MTTPKQPPRRPPSTPELILDAQPERRAVHHSGVDGVPQAPPRKGTLLGLGAARPASGEFSATVPAPRPDAATLRAPTSASGTEIETQVAPVESASAGQLAALVAERDRLLLEKAQRARDDAAKAETRIVSYPPAVAPSPPKPVPAPQSEAALETAAIEGVLVWLAKRAAANRKAIYGIVAAISLGGGGVALKTASEKPGPPALTKADFDAALDKLRTRKGGFDDQTRLLNEQLQLTKCLRRKVTQIGESVLPAPDHQGATRKIQPFEDDCPENPRPMPDP